MCLVILWTSAIEVTCFSQNESRISACCNLNWVQICCTSNYRWDLLLSVFTHSATFANSHTNNHLLSNWIEDIEVSWVKFNWLLESLYIVQFHVSPVLCLTDPDKCIRLEFALFTCLDLDAFNFVNWVFGADLAIEVRVYSTELLVHFFFLMLV